MPYNEIFPSFQDLLNFWEKGVKNSQGINIAN